MQTLRPLLAALLLAALVPGVAADGRIYRWVDAQGRVHYGDQPARGASEVRVPRVDASGSPAPAAPAISQADCDRTRAELDNYRQAKDIVERDALGKERRYTPEERQQLIAITEGKLAAACGAVPRPAS